MTQLFSIQLELPKDHFSIVILFVLHIHLIRIDDDVFQHNVKRSVQWVEAKFDEIC